jgi:small subunit ribosomal protein S9
MARTETHSEDNDKNVVRAVGRRKEASARIRLELGDGNITVNGDDLGDYLPVQWWIDDVHTPLEIVSKAKDFDVSIKISGGGHHGQSEAMQLGIARALVEWNEDWKPMLKAKGLLTRDPRVKERKKFGNRKARRSPQWRKR